MYFSKASPRLLKWIRGLPYMTSAVGGGEGDPKKQTKGTKSDDLGQWQGGRGSKNPKILPTSYMEAPLKCSDSCLSQELLVTHWVILGTKKVHFEGLCASPSNEASFESYRQTFKSFWGEELQEELHKECKNRTAIVTTLESMNRSHTTKLTTESTIFPNQPTQSLWV